MTYWIVFATIYLHFYLWIFAFILRILKFIQSIYAFLQKPVKFWWGQCSFCKVFILKMFLCLIFHKTFLPVNVELMLMVKKPLTLIIICYLYVPCKSSRLDAAFRVWLWPQVRYLVCIRQVTFVSIFQNEYKWLLT